MDPPFISVIIPTFGRPRQLGECLDALASQTWPRDRFEVVVVDDGSPMPLEHVVDRYRDRLGLRLVRQENSGPAAARNVGATVARGSLLAFTDDDCLPESGWLEALARSHRRKPRSILGGAMVNDCAGNLYAVTSQLILDSAYAFYNRNPDDARFFASSNIALPASGFEGVGGFSPTFRIASEDRDLCDRWRWRGNYLCWVPDAVVRHAKQLRFGSFVRQHFSYGRGAFQFHRECARRHSTSFSRELVRYPVFVRTTLASVARQPRRRALPVLGLLLLGQAANAAGFAWAVVRRPPQPA